MKSILNALYILVLIVFITYLFPKSPPFPPPPPDAVQSMEKADTETTLRRAYFTNYTRDQIIAHYKAHFRHFPTLNLNYPPEDAQTLIRDQTRSYYLEELVHPFRESLYINGFIPTKAKDEIWYKGEHFQQKITIKYSPSNIYVRIILAVITSLVAYMIINLFLQSLNELSVEIFQYRNNDRKKQRVR